MLFNIFYSMCVLFKKNENVNESEAKRKRSVNETGTERNGYCTVLSQFCDEFKHCVY